MYKSFLTSLILLSLISVYSYSQDDRHSIEFTGGVIHPRRSTEGLSGTIQFYYSISPQTKLYARVGYLAWDSHYFIYRKSIDYRRVSIRNDHEIIPVYIGSKINFHTNDFLTSFVNIEIGFSSFSYNNRKLDAIENPETREVDYYSGKATPVEENLLGIGIGAGFSHPISEITDLVFTFMLNSFVNSAYYGFLSAKGTYTTISAGFNFNI